jgi:hypothetical protein
MFKYGLIAFGIGIVVAFTPLQPLGLLISMVGVGLMFMAGGVDHRSQQVTYYDESKHYHLHNHNHNYPRQTITEGTEYRRENADGTSHSVRYLKKSE